MRARHRQALAAIVIAGGAVRFATLGVQSYWLDEVATVNLLHKSFGSMVSGVVSGESTPPLYYCLAWVWAKLFGAGEAGLRSLSALLGTATIAVAYALGRRVAGRTAGLVAAALCAFNPLLVWYSQEARSYALLVLIGALTLLTMDRALERATARRLALWALASAAALATHYFAGFLIGAEAIWLLRHRQTRARIALAVGSVTIAAAALLPLALHQHSTGAAKFISQSSLLKRLAEIPKQFAIGYHGPVETPLLVVTFLIVAFALDGIARSGGIVRRRVTPLAAIGVAAVGAPLVLALIGPDYLIARNVLPAWPALVIPLAAVLATRRLGIALTALACAVGLVVIVSVASDERYQRDDWRDAARALGPLNQTRAIIVTPASGGVPLLHYLRGAQRVPRGGVDVKELDYVGLAQRLPGQAPHPPRPEVIPLPGFGEFAREEGETYTVVREGTASPLHVGATVGLSPLDSRPAVVIYQRYPAR